MSLTDNQDRPVEVTHNEDARRYLISYEGEGDPVGYLEYQDSNGERDFTHTVVDPAFGGRGLAGILVHQATNDAAAQNLAVVGTCSYVAKWLEDHGYDGEWRTP